MASTCPSSRGESPRVGSEPREERVHAVLGAGPRRQTRSAAGAGVAYDDPIGVSALRIDSFVDADDFRPGGTGAPQLLARVLPLEALTVCHSRGPSRRDSFGDVVDGRGPAPPPDVEREALGLAVDCRPESRAARASTRQRRRTRDPPQFELHHDPHASAREIADRCTAILEAALHADAHATAL